MLRPTAEGWETMKGARQLNKDRRVLFVSNMNDAAWGGSEELWTGAASVLASEGIPVSASVHGWSPLHPRIVELGKAGVTIQARRTNQRLYSRVWNKLAMAGTAVGDVEVEKFINASGPALVVMSCTPFWT